MERILPQLKKRTEVADWRIKQIQQTSYQLFVIGSTLDTIRKVTTNKYFLELYVDFEDFRGSTILTLFDHELPHLDSRLENAIYMAQRIKNPKYTVPEPAEYPFVETFDPTLLGDIEDVLFINLADRLIDLVDREQDVRLASSEYFLDLRDIKLKNSKGVELEYRTSEILFDGVLLAGSKADEVETHFELRARRLQDLPLEDIVPRYAQYARDSVTAELPRSGRMPVVISDDALSGLFAPLIYQTSGDHQHRGTSTFKPGQSIFGQDKCSGEPLTMISNGYVPFGLRTTPADADGVPCSRFELIREGVFERPWTTQKDADYLGTTPTGQIGNIEIPIGPHSTAVLLDDTVPVLHIVEFSALLPDVVSGNFSTEIRLGYEHKGDSIRPVKGGSLSGNLLQCFSDAAYSTESQSANYALSLESFGSYIGPKAIRFNTFQVSGK